MATNPNLIPSNLNRIRGTVLVPGNATLNITAPYLGKEGITISPQSAVVTQMQGMTTVVNSEEPYQIVQVTAAVMKSLALSAAYIEQIKTSPTLGTVTVTPDTTVLAPFTLYNVAIINWGQMSMAGVQPDFVVTFQGLLPISNDLWNLL
jgi:hypothetical protein